MYEIRDFEYLFQREIDNAGEFRFNERCNHRVKTIKSGGSVLEVEVYRVFPTKTACRRPKVAITSEEQRKINQKNAEKKFERMINTNFTPEDLHVTLTYNGYVTIEQARKHVQNFNRRVRRLREKMQLPSGKYAYVIEGNDGDALPGKPRAPKAHHHVIMSGLGDIHPKALLALWEYGYINADPLQRDSHGNIDFEALAKYVMKDPKGKKRWACSKNMLDPAITTADKKLSKRKIEAIANSAEIEGKKIFEYFHPGYELSSIRVHRSDWIDGVFIYVKMHKIDKPDNRTPSARTHTRARAGQYQNRKKVT